MVLLQIDSADFFLLVVLFPEAPPMHSASTVKKLASINNSILRDHVQFPFALVQSLSLSVNIVIPAMITNCEVV